MDKIQWLFSVYKDMQEAITREGVSDVLDDIKHYYPDLYEKLEAEFKRRQRIRDIGVLLAGSM